VIAGRCVTMEVDPMKLLCVIGACALLLGSGSAQACTCGQATWEEFFDAADVVFAGVVTASGLDGYGIWFDVAVSACWKGVTDPGTSVRVHAPPGGNGSCDLGFCCFPGSEMTVWAYGPPYHTNSCWPTHGGAPYGEEAEFLGPSICHPVAVQGGTWGRVKATYR
jgi:hypothetical protein